MKSKNPKQIPQDYYTLELGQRFAISRTDVTAKIKKYSKNNRFKCAKNYWECFRAGLCHAEIAITDFLTNLK